MSTLRIAVLHSEDRGLATGDPKHPLAVQAPIHRPRAAPTRLRSRGHAVSVHGVPRDAPANARLLARPPGDLVLHFVDSQGADAHF